MKSKICEPTPTPWLTATLGPWRIRGDACNFESIQKAVSIAFEPARMSRFDCNPTVESFSQHAEERASIARIEGEARWQLHEQAAGARSQRRDCGEKISN